MGRRMFNVFHCRPAMDKLLMLVYFGYLGSTVALGLAGEILGLPALCQLAVKLAMVFLCTLGVLMSVGVVLVCMDGLLLRREGRP
jgi:hypothetical protein